MRCMMGTDRAQAALAGAVVQSHAHALLPELAAGHW
jgi:hypothetical protein